MGVTMDRNGSKCINFYWLLRICKWHRRWQSQDKDVVYYSTLSRTVAERRQPGDDLVPTRDRQSAPLRHATSESLSYRLDQPFSSIAIFWVAGLPPPVYATSLLVCAVKQSSWWKSTASLWDARKKSMHFWATAEFAVDCSGCAAITA